MRSRGRSSTSTSPSAWAKASRAREARSFMISLVSRRRAISAWSRPRASSRPKANVAGRSGSWGSHDGT